MKYNGKELKEVTEPQIFDPPKKMLCWDEYSSAAIVDNVYAIGPSSMDSPVRAISDDGRTGTHCYRYCANIPEKPKSRRATWKELAYWLIDGKGIVLDENRGKIDTGVIFGKEYLNIEVSDYIKVMRRDDTDWHEPDAQYMGLEEK